MSSDDNKLEQSPVESMDISLMLSDVMELVSELVTDGRSVGEFVSMKTGRKGGGKEGGGGLCVDGIKTCRGGCGVGGGASGRFKV